jgi:undecaprenyl pyrophosphate phosphatase UppP
MVQLVRKSKLTYFAWYCAIAGVTAITAGTLVA